MLDVLISSDNLYGLPERKVKGRLETTENCDPYRIFAIDKFPNVEWSSQGLYSGIPYITAHHSKFDASVLWFTASETWIDILPTKDEDEKRSITFMTESGALEMFIFATSKGPKHIMRQVAKITGFPMLPPFYSLGFHYSKWEETSADHMVWLNN